MVVAARRGMAEATKKLIKSDNGRYKTVNQNEETTMGKMSQPEISSILLYLSKMSFRYLVYQ